MPGKTNAELEEENRQLRDDMKNMKENMTILEGMNVMSNFVLRRFAYITGS